MPNYRRAFVAGASWFFTVNLFERKSRLLVDHIDALREAVRETRQRFPFEIDAMVVLPDHLHAVWTLPEGDCDFPVRWRLIKIRFSKSIPGGEPLTTTRRVRGERGIWQRRYWEHMIRDERDYSRHIDYCWLNPVKHGLVANVEDWPFSSFHRDNRDNPRPGDLARFERALAEYTRSSHSSGYGERAENGRVQ
jgi:putative transposase